jgi:hypothetical protein
MSPYPLHPFDRPLYERWAREPPRPHRSVRRRAARMRRGRWLRALRRGLTTLLARRGLERELGAVHPQVLRDLGIEPARVHRLAEQGARAAARDRDLREAA